MENYLVDMSRHMRHIGVHREDNGIEVKRLVVSCYVIRVHRENESYLK